MVSKAPGASLCAHCRALPVKETCPGCLREVCDSCFRDWTTCDEPRARVLRLGRGARLRKVSRNGRFGVVSRWPNRVRMVDLVRAEYHVDLPSMSYTRLGAPTRDGTYAWADTITANDQPMRHKVFWGTIEQEVSKAAPSGASLCRRDRTLYYAHDEERILAFDSKHRNEVHVLDPALGRVLQSVYLEELDGGFLVTGTYGVIDILRTALDGSVTEIGQVRTADMDTVWAEAAHDRFAAVTQGNDGCCVKIAEVGDASVDVVAAWSDFADQRETIADLQQPVAAALSEDARFLALALRSRAVMVHDLISSQRRLYGGHRDDICMVAFTDSGALVSADCDNRVVIRPRASEFFADVTLAEEQVL